LAVLMSIALYLLPLALLSSAVSFLGQWTEQWGPEWPTTERIWKGIPAFPWGEPVDMALWIVHFLNNLTTESLRADPEWWGKFLCFIILAQLILILLRKWRRP
jgi:hypothetical protein